MRLDQLQFVILFGKTGSGKSEILRSIQKKGGQVLDLEQLASHNGSAFGGLGKTTQPGQSEFDEQIGKKLEIFNSDLPVWVEYESDYLGNLQIPEFLKHQIGSGKMIVIKLERDYRIERIVRSYSKHPIDDLLTAVRKIKSKLSEKKYRLARKCIREKDFSKAASIILTYYDKIYENGLNASSCEIVGKINLIGTDSADHANQVLDLFHADGR